ncbi:hypothetical protein GCM10025867_46650 (plasmid) [Frondihabitans sucicola]|uniref:XRE family transcriptional regulator n=1 Tax=Frondihabitans sucicola TaxID=1268041 RepID=A0ABM8GVC8_9MICO|nr:hypothetical protein GCM10025867_46650 [Frondihabitans sucicola]
MSATRAEPTKSPSGSEQHQEKVGRLRQEPLLAELLSVIRRREELVESRPGLVNRLRHDGWSMNRIGKRIAVPTPTVVTWSRASAVPTSDWGHVMPGASTEAVAASLERVLLETDRAGAWRQRLVVTLQGQGYSIRVIADASGIAQGTVQYWLTHDGQRPRPEAAARSRELVAIDDGRPAGRVPYGTKVFCEPPSTGDFPRWQALPSGSTVSVSGGFGQDARRAPGLARRVHAWVGDALARGP